jgi:hypothetical protein
MTSSGTYNFQLGIGDFTINAFERCGIAKPEMTANHFKSASRELDLMLSSEWSNRLVNLWKVTLNSQALTQGTATYTLPANVIMMLDAYRSTTSGGVQTDIFMTPISRDDYASYPQKQIQAPPTIYWFNRQIQPTVTLFPVPDGGGPYTLNYYCCTQIQDANLPYGETPDIPIRWYDAMLAGLSYRLARIYAPALEDKRKADYAEAWGLAANQDLENTPVRIVPKLNNYWPR